VLLWGLLAVLKGGKAMFPSEMTILMAIAMNKGSSKKLLNRPMDVTGEYIGYLYDSLVKRGFIRKNGLNGYRLTSMGKETLLEFLHKNGIKAIDMIKRLQLLGIEIGQKSKREIDKLENEAIKVN